MKFKRYEFRLSPAAEAVQLDDWDGDMWGKERSHYPYRLGVMCVCDTSDEGYSEMNHICLMSVFEDYEIH